LNLQNLGLCRKAGALAIGFDAVVEAMKKNKAKGVLTAIDISPKTLKEVKFYAEKYKIDIINISAEKDEIGKILGKNAAVLAITDEKLLNLIK
jgi:ribosomal protein L7Ae-like RNA K-turn-binding protein